MKPNNNSRDSLQEPVRDGGGGDRNSIASYSKRLFVRNISFKVDEDSLRAHFQELGEVVHVNIPRRPDGSLVGCAFVQYKKMLQATEALKDCNDSQLLGRTITVDWALPKHLYRPITEAGSGG